MHISGYRGVGPTHNFREGCSNAHQRVPRCWSPTQLQGELQQCTSAGTEVLVPAVAHSSPPPTKAVQNAATVNARSSVAP